MLVFWFFYLLQLFHDKSNNIFNNNIHILEGSSEGEKLIGGLMSYVDNEIKNDNHENIVSNKWYT